MAPKPVKPGEQQDLFAVEQEWEKEWKGMPEFVQKEQKPFGTIHVHFNNYEDMVEFGVKIGHKVNAETKFLWYPQIDIKSVKDKRWVDNVHTDDCQCETCLQAFTPATEE